MKVLVVEDERKLARTLREGLEAEATVGPTGEEGWALRRFRARVSTMDGPSTMRGSGEA